MSSPIPWKRKWMANSSFNIRERKAFCRFRYGSRLRLLGLKRTSFDGDDAGARRASAGAVGRSGKFEARNSTNENLRRVSTRLPTPLPTGTNWAGDGGEAANDCLAQKPAWRAGTSFGNNNVMCYTTKSTEICYGHRNSYRRTGLSSKLRN